MPYDPFGRGARLPFDADPYGIGVIAPALAQAPTMQMPAQATPPAAFADGGMAFYGLQPPAAAPAPAPYFVQAPPAPPAAPAAPAAPAPSINGAGAQPINPSIPASPAGQTAPDADPRAWETIKAQTGYDALSLEQRSKIWTDYQISVLPQIAREFHVEPEALADQWRAAFAQDEPKAPNTSFWGDIGRAANRGVAAVANGPYEIAAALGSKWAEGVASSVRKDVEQLQRQDTAEMQNARKRLSETGGRVAEIQKRKTYPGGWGYAQAALQNPGAALADLGEAAAEVAANPRLAVTMGVESLPSMLGIGIGGRVAGAAAKAAGAGAWLARGAAVAGVGAASTAMSAGQIAQNVNEEVGAMSDAEAMKHAPGAANPDEARATIKREAFATLEVLGAAAAAGSLDMIGPGVEKVIALGLKNTGRAARDGLLKGMAKGYVTEGAQEAVQSGIEEAGSGLARERYRPGDPENYAKILQQAGAGAAVGAPLGAGAHAAAHLRAGKTNGIKAGDGAAGIAAGLGVSQADVDAAMAAQPSPAAPSGPAMIEPPREAAPAAEAPKKVIVWPDGAASAPLAPEPKKPLQGLAKKAVEAYRRDNPAAMHGKSDQEVLDFLRKRAGFGSVPADEPVQSGEKGAPPPVQSGEKGGGDRSGEQIGAAPPPAPQVGVPGREDQVVRADGARTPVRYQVVDADQIVPSHSADGTPNAAYAQGVADLGVNPQNRDRGDKALVAQVNSIAARPDYLRVGPSRDFGTGAPVVAEGEGGKLYAVAGNGRSAGLQEAYRRGTADAYRRELVADAPNYGAHPAAVAKMRQPVLVRVMPRDAVTPDIGDVSNRQQTAAQPRRAQAFDDAQRLKGVKIEFRQGEDGDLFVSPQSVADFVRAMPEAERAGIVNERGAPLPAARDRLVSAILADTYGSQTLVRAQAEDLTGAGRNVVNGLAAAAPTVREVARDLPEFAATYAQAAESYLEGVKAGRKPDQMAAQSDIEHGNALLPIMQFLADNRRSARAIQEGVARHARRIREAMQAASGSDMFGAPAERPVVSDMMGWADDGKFEASRKRGRAEAPSEVVQGRAGDATGQGAGAQDRGGAERGSEGSREPAAAGRSAEGAAQRDEVAGQVGKGDGGGVVSRIRNAIANIETPRQRRDTITEREKAIDDLTKIVARQKAFPKEDEWGQTKARIEALEAELKPKATKTGGSKASRARAGVTGATVASVRDELRQSPEARAALDGGHVEIVQSAGDLPGVGNEGIAGFYDGRKAYLVADGIEPGRAFSVFLHEVGAHHGLKRLIGGDLYEKAAPTIRQAAKGRGPAAEAAKAAIRRAGEDAVLRGETDPQTRDDETVAYFVEEFQNLPTKPLGPARALFDRIVAAAKVFLGRQLGLNVSLTPAQIHQAALGAARRASWATDFEPSDAGLAAGVRAGLFSRRTRGADVLDSIDGDRPWTPQTATAPPSLRRDHVGRGGKLGAYIEDATLPFKEWLWDSGATRRTVESVMASFDLAQHRQRVLSDEIRHKFLEPAYRKMTEAAKAHGVSADDVVNLVGYWMTARYAPEVNARLMQSDAAKVRSGEMTQAEADARRSDIRNPRLDHRTFVGPGVAGGMTDAIAKAIEIGVERKIPRAELEEIAGHFYDMHAARIDSDLRSGRITAQEAALYRDNRHYVPMTGDPRAQAGDEEGFFGKPNRPNQARDKSLKGRKTIADNGVKASIEAALKSVGWSAYAEFKTAFGDLYQEALAHHGSARALESAIGLSMERGQKITTRNTDNVIIDRSSGIERVYSLPPEIMEALRAQNRDEVPLLLKPLTFATRIMARAVTQFMPAFAPVNAIRDIWEKTELLRSRDIHDAAGRPVDVNAIARASLAYAVSPEAWSASAAQAAKRKVTNSVAGRRLNDLIRLGGLSTWGHHLDRSQKDIEKEVRKSIGMAGPLNAAGKKVMHAVEAYNNTFETISTLSVYQALLDAGVEPKKAAWEALDLANFGKSGIAIKPIAGLFMFARPTAIGSANMVRQLLTRRGATRFGAYLAAGVLTYMMLRGMAGDDDEAGNKVDNLSQFMLERSIPIPLGGGAYFKMPIGFGMPMLAWGLAVAGVKKAVGEYDWKEFAGETALTLGKHFSPTPPSDVPAARHPLDFAVKTVTPTIVRPFMSIALDRNDFGQKITPAFPNERLLRAEQAPQTIAPIFQDIAIEVARATGGKVDLYPKQVETLIRGYAVGPLAEAMQVGVINPSREAQGKKVGAADMPIVKRFIGKDNEFAISTKARETLDDYAPIARLKALEEKRGSGVKLDAEDEAKVKLYEEHKARDRSFQTEAAGITRRFNSGKLSETERDRLRKGLNGRRDKEAAEFLYQARRLEGRPTTRTTRSQ